MNFKLKNVYENEQKRQIEMKKKIKNQTVT